MSIKKNDRERNLLQAAMIMCGEKSIDLSRVFDGHRYVLGSETPVQLEEASPVGAAMTVGKSGDAKFTVVARTPEGEYAVPLSLMDTVKFMATITGFLGLTFSSGEEFMTAAEKTVAKRELREALTYFFDLDAEADQIRQRVDKMYAAREAANFEVLERKATERAEKAMQNVIRRLATAASMPEGLEKSVLLEETAPMIRKAYQEG